MGVFLGVSTLSVVEIIYFLTVRKTVNEDSASDGSTVNENDETFTIDEIKSNRNSKVYNSLAKIS